MQTTDKIKSLYDPHREWENFDFPIEISKLTFEKNLHDLPESCVIRIWRDESFKLRGSIEGYTLKAKSLSENKLAEGEGNFAELDTISGRGNSEETIYTLSECVIGSFSLTGIFYPGFGVPFSADLHFTTFKRESIQASSHFIPAIRYDWFICSHVHFFYPYSTTRSNRDGTAKAREGFDSPLDKDILPVQHSRDFFVINMPGYKCIVACVPKDFKVGWADCMCIEYRSDFVIPDHSHRDSISNFLSFLLGTELLKIGSSELDRNGTSRQEAVSPSGNDVVHKCQNGSTPPVQFNTTYEWGKIQHLVDTLFPVFIEQGKALNLDSVLWRYFQAKNLTVGVNLPVLSSALEKLASSYLRYHTEISLAYLPEEEYTNLIAPELNTITQKLSSVEGAEKIINKIRGAFYRGTNEKMELFFNSIDLPISKLERQALKARNLMAHGGADAKSKKEALKQVLLTRAYETLFHRVFLRVLGYNDYYIDYYLTGRKSKKITVPTGPPTAANI